MPYDENGNSEKTPSRQVNVTSDTGDVYAATPEQLESLKSLGYQKETPAAEGERLTQRAEQNYYSGGWEQAKALGEGALSGASLGISDWLLDDEDTRGRARYNPGTRLAGELLGAVGAAALSGGEGLLGQAARLTPTGAAAALSGRALGAGTKAALALEGAIQGAGSAASHAVLNNDPLTVESLAAGAGSGALFAYGLGMLSGGIKKLGAHAEGVLEGRSAEAAKAALNEGNPGLRRFVSDANEFNRVVDRTLKTVEKEVTPANLAAILKRTSSVADEARMAAQSAPGMDFSKFGAMERELRPLLVAAKKGASAGGETGAAAVRAYREAVARAAESVGIKAELPAMGAAAAEEVGNIAQLRGAFRRLPSNPAELAAMGDTRATELLEKLRRGLKPTGSELDGLRQSMTESLAATLEHAGLKPASQSVDGLVDALGSYREQLKKLASTAAKGSAVGGRTNGTFLGIISKATRLAASRGANDLARSAGAGAMVSALAYHGAGMGTGTLMAELIGLRSAAMGHVEELIAKISPVASRGLRRLAPVSERLRTRLDGSQDPEKDLRKLAGNRAKEIVEAQTVAPDVAYTVAEPLQAVDPDLALKLSQQVLNGLTYLGRRAPRDPGATNVFLSSDWRPSESQAIQLAAAYEAVTHPMEALERMLFHTPDQATADALWETSPALMQHAAIKLLERAPELQQRSDLATRTALSTAFRVPLDGLMHPTSIAALQAQFIPSGRGMSSNGQGMKAPSSNGGRPPAVDSNVMMTHTQSLIR